MKTPFTGFQCSLCGHEYLPHQVTYTCPVDGGNLDVILDLDDIRRRFQPEDFTCRAQDSLWRYLPLLPVSDPGGEGTPLKAAGWTPVFSPPLLAEKYGLRHFFIKDESYNPTGSFKDRASAVVVARAYEIGAWNRKSESPTIVTASTGNAGAALAGMAAAMGCRAIIVAPRSAPPAKVAQLLVYGARVILVNGTYDDAFDLTIQAAQEFNWYCRNTGYNPFTAEGKKTAAFEIWEWSKQQAELSGLASLTIFVPVGDGNIISGLYKGFQDLQGMGWINDLPRLIGVQAEGSAAVANAFHAGKNEIVPVTARTIADSISVDLPRDGLRALRAVRQTGGTCLTVSDSEILAALSDLGRAGIFAEPAGAAACAGLIKARQLELVQPGDFILGLNTGSGLKDIRAAVQATGEAPVIEPELEALRKFAI